MARSRLVVSVAFVAVVLLGSSPTIANSSQSEVKTCDGKFVGQEPTERQLQEVLKLHSEFVALKSEAARVRNRNKRANLCGALLNNTDLSGAKLEGANLSGAKLEGANLSGANLFEADLRGAIVYFTDLSGAELHGANLANTVFLRMHKRQLPSFVEWQAVENLSLAHLVGDAATISAFRQLREEFKNNGMRAEERGVTAALERAQTREMTTNPLERAFRFIAFDATSEYGYSPGRPLAILLLAILLLALPYTVALMMDPGRRGAIWMVWDEERLLDISSNENTKKKREQLSSLTFPRAILYGLYFSLLSAFHFGWRDLNVGNWISRIQSREYVLRASGWVRVVSGVQSLLSVYLVALWVLTYFGRPFE